MHNGSANNKRQSRRGERQGKRKKVKVFKREESNQKKCEEVRERLE